MNEYRLKRTLFGNFVVQIAETKHYTKDLNGSGFYDEWTVKEWRNAKLEDISDLGFKLA